MASGEWTMAAFGQTVIIADDDPVTSDRLYRLLKRAGYRTAVYEGEGTFGSVGYFEGTPAIMIVGDQFGADFLRFVTSIGCTLPVIFLHSNNSVREAVTIIQAGAADYLTKPFCDDTILTAVKRAMITAGQLATVRSQQKISRERAAALSEREREIVRLVLTGLLNKQIADELGIALITVKVHRGRAMRKLGARTAAELARIVQDSGLLPEVKKASEPHQSVILALPPKNIASSFPAPPFK